MSLVYIVGAGPGDPELITIKGLRCIQQADVILYDRLVNKKLLEEAKPDVELIYCGKLPNHHTMKQPVINQTLIDHAKRGKVVVRLKGGDPFVFGRGAEEAEALASQGIDYQVVPGITAGIAAPAYADIPLTYRGIGRSFAVVTGHCTDGNEAAIKWGDLAKSVDTLVIYMGIQNLDYIINQLCIQGKSIETPIAIVQEGTTAKQRVVTGTLEDISLIVKQNNIKNPAVIVIGEVVRIRKRLNEAKLASGMIDTRYHQAL